MMKRIVAASACMLMLATSAPVYSSKLRPEGTVIEQKLAEREAGYWERRTIKAALAAIQLVGEPVHEEITNRILGCEGDSAICGDPQIEPDNAYVLAGVRWNDDPPFRLGAEYAKLPGCVPDSTIRLVTFPLCWASVFKDGSKRAAAGTELTGRNAALLTRSHFGDLQFLHAMAWKDGASAREVQGQILAWAEFTWKLALQEIKLDTLVREVPVEGVAQIFSENGWSVQDLFALGNPHVRRPSQVSRLAFGSLLHVVQDSFARGHVERESMVSYVKCGNTQYRRPGRIIEFHSYINQDSKKHGHEDTAYAFNTSLSHAPNVIEVGQALAELYERKAPWDEAKPYLECIFELAPEVRDSGPGSAFQKKAL